MNTEATDLIKDGDRIAGVKAKTPEGMIDIEADLTVACDGRHSTVRERAGLAVEEIGAPMDVLWFRAGKRANETENVFARVDPGKMMVTFDRGDYWQCAYVIAKGQYDAVKARGLPALLDDVVTHGADPQIRHLRRQELGRREAPDGRDQSPDAMDAARGCSASAMPRMRCRRSAASASISRCRTRSRPRTCSRQNS